jgi:hypothetical protein
VFELRAKRGHSGTVGPPQPSDVQHEERHVSDWGGDNNPYGRLRSLLTPGQPSARCGLAVILFLIASSSLVPVHARMAAPQRHDPSTGAMPGLDSSEMGNGILPSIRLDQSEGRTGIGSEMRWEGEGWFGDKMNNLWLKSEGFSENGAVSDSDPEVVYDHPIFRPYSLDAQAGIRPDLDSAPYRAWAVSRVEGLAPYSVEVAPTLSGRNGCYGAGRATDSTDLLLTQKWILQPQAELNVRSKDDVPVKLDRASPTSKPGFVCSTKSATNSHRKLDSRTTADSVKRPAMRGRPDSPPAVSGSSSDLEFATNVITIDLSASRRP